MTENDSAVVDRLPSRRMKVDILDGLASSRVDAGRYEEGLATAERAYDLAVDVSPHERMHTSFTLMLVASLLGKWDRVVEVLDWHAAAAAAEPMVTCPNVRGGGPLGATILVRRGEIERAMEIVPLEEGAMERVTLFDRALIDRYAALVGEVDYARTLADSIDRQGDRPRYPDGLDAFVEALLILGRDDEAERFIPAMRELARTDVRLGAAADRTEAELLIKRGQPDQARILLDRAMKWFDEKALSFDAARTREVLASISPPAAARPLLEAAVETYVQLGARPYADAARASLVKVSGDTSPLSG
jgi:hypothetical protein